MASNHLAGGRFTPSSTERILRHEHDGLGVDDFCPDSQVLGRFFDHRKAMRPIGATTRQDSSASIVKVNRNAVAIPFDLVDPILTKWRSRLIERKARLDT